MLSKSPNKRDPRRAKYAKMLLDMFLKEQPESDLERVFGSTSTVVAAAAIAAEQGAFIPNIAQLLRNPGATQPNPEHERLIELASHAVPTPGTVAAATFTSLRPAGAAGGNERRHAEGSSREGAGRAARKPRPPSPSAAAAFAALRARAVASASANSCKSAASASASGASHHHHSSAHSAGKPRPKVHVITPDDVRFETRSRNHPDRVFFARENVLRAANPGMAHEEVLAVLVSSALHLNDVDELADPELRQKREVQHQQQQHDHDLNAQRLGRKQSFELRDATASKQQHQQANASLAASMNVDSSRAAGAALASVAAAASDSTKSTPVTRHVAPLFAPPSNSTGGSSRTLLPADRINPEVQHLFRDTQSVFHRVPAGVPYNVSGKNSHQEQQQQQNDHSFGSANFFGEHAASSPAMAGVSLAGHGADSRLPSPQKLSSVDGRQFAHAGVDNLVDSFSGAALASHFVQLQQIQNPLLPRDTTATPHGELDATLAATHGGSIIAASVAAANGGGASPSPNANKGFPASAGGSGGGGGGGDGSPASASPLCATFGSVHLHHDQASDAQFNLGASVRGGAGGSGVMKNNNNKNSSAAVKKTVAVDVAPPPPIIVDGRLDADECIAAIEAAFPDVKLATVVQQAMVCDHKVEDLYFQSVGKAQGDEEPEVRRGTISMREAEDLLFAAFEPALDLFLFLGAFDPQATCKPLSLPDENIDGTETWLKLRQRLEILNGRFDPLLRVVNKMLGAQLIEDSTLEIAALSMYKQNDAAKKKKSSRPQLSTASGGDGDGASGSAGGGGGGGGGGDDDLADALENERASRDGPLPYSVPIGSPVNCFQLQQFVIPMIRLCEFEIIPWCVLDIYCSVLFPTIADLGFVGLYSTNPPLIDFEMFSALLAVHRLVLHRRENQVLAIRRQLVSSMPNTPWVPLVQRRVMRQSMLVAQAHKRGKGGLGQSTNSMMSAMSQSSSNMAALLTMTRTRSMSMSSRPEFVATQHGSMNNNNNNMLMMMPASSNSKDSMGTTPSGLHMLHTANSKDSGFGGGAVGIATASVGGSSSILDDDKKLKRSGSVRSMGSHGDQQHQQHPQHLQHQQQHGQTGSSGSTETPQAHKDLLTLSLDDGIEAEQSHSEFVNDDDLDDTADQCDALMEQIEGVDFKRRTCPAPHTGLAPNRVTGVSPLWPDNIPRSKLAKWQSLMRQVPSRHNVPEDERPLSYRRLPLYDDRDAPVYDGPAQLSRQYAELLAEPPSTAMKAELQFAVRKLDRDVTTNLPRFDKTRPSSARQWQERDATDGKGVVDGRVHSSVTKKPLLGLRSGLYWFCAKEDANVPVGSAEEAEMLEERVRLNVAEAKLFAREQQQQQQRPPGSNSVSRSATSHQLQRPASSLRPASSFRTNTSGDGDRASTAAPPPLFDAHGGARSCVPSTRLATRRPFCSMARQHTPCHPPPLAALPPPPRPASAASKTAREALDRFSLNPQVPTFSRGETPTAMPQVQHDVFEQYLQEKRLREMQQHAQEETGQAAAAATHNEVDADGEPIPQRSRTTDQHNLYLRSQVSTFNKQQQQLLRPGTAGAARPFDASTAAAAGNGTQTPYTGFRSDIALAATRPASAISTGSNDQSSRVSDFLKAYKQQPIPVRRTSPTSMMATSNTNTPHPRVSPVRQQHRYQQPASHQQQQQTVSASGSSAATTTSQSASPPALGPSSPRRAAAASGTCALTVALQHEFGQEADIPNLTRDQSSSFHTLLRDARREAHQRVAQQTAMDEITRIQAKAAQSPEEFHDQVMSWYKKGLGRSYMMASPEKSRHRSPMSSVPQQRHPSILQ